MRQLRLCALATIWILCVAPAFATPVVTPLHLTFPPAIEDSGRHPGPPSKPNGPITVNWKFKGTLGFMNLIVNPDGTWLFSGSYTKSVPNKDIIVTLALKNKLGGIILFHYEGNVSNSGVQWSKEGKDTFLKEDFNTFAPPQGAYYWSGNYHFDLTAQAQQEQLADEKAACAEDAASGALEWLGQSYIQFCKQFNAAW